jgi:hypothetical protein
MTYQISFIQWFLILIFSLALLICLLFGIRQFFSKKVPVDVNDRIRRSLIVAGWSSLSFFFAVSIIGVLIWADTGIFKSLLLASPILCLAPFLFLLVAFGAYIKDIWYTKLDKYTEGIVKRQIERFESHDQEPPSK